MDNLSPTLNLQQLKQNINTLQKGGMTSDKIQSYVNNYQKVNDGSFILKGDPKIISQDNTISKVGNIIAGNQTPETGALFSSSANNIQKQGPGVTAAKTVANVVPDFVRTTVGLPIQTTGLVKKVGTETQGLVQDSGGIAPAIVNMLKALGDPSTYVNTLKAIIPSAAQKLIKGDLNGAAQDISNHPFQQIAPFLMVLEKGAGGIDKVTGGTPEIKTFANGEQATPTISARGLLQKGTNAVVEPTIEAAKTILKSASTAITGASNLAQKLAKFSTSQATGLSPDTISRIISNPQEFSPSAMKDFTREGVAGQALSDVNQRLAELQDTGKAYQPLREAKTPVNIPKGTFEGVLQKYGIGVDANGKLTFDKESIPTSSGDQSALQHWYDTYGKDAEHSSNSVLNARKGLDNLAQWDSSKTDAANRLAMELRATLNTVARPQIGGLEGLDNKYSSEIADLKKVKTDYFNSDGSLKDNTIGKIANLTNKGRDSVLARLEKVSPGIGEKVRTLKAVEDIHAASGQKVGTYARAGLGIFGAATFNAPAIVAAILTSPDIATRVLRGYGKVMGVTDVVLNRIVTSYQNNSK